MVRRWLVAPLLAAALLGIAACGGAPASSSGTPSAPASASGSGKPAAPGSGASAASKPYAGRTLRVGMWGGDNEKEVAQIVGKPFTALTGAKVVYVPGNPSNNIAKVRAAQGTTPPMDIVNFSDTEESQWAGSKLFERIDYAKIPNSKDLPSFLKLPQFAAFDGIEFGLVYNAQKYKQLGLPAPTSINDLLNPKVAGHVALPTSAVDWAPMVTMAMAAANGGSMSDLAPAYPALKKVKVYYYYQSSADLANKFSSGDVWVAAWQSSYTFRLQRKGLPLKFVRLGYQGKEGWPSIDYYGIAAGSPNADLADIYINLALDPKIQYEYAKWGFRTPTNEKAFPLVAADRELASRLPTLQQMLNMVHPDWKTFYAHSDAWLRAYNAATGAR
jgi:putative spermidine/putrescine transport system substrate-binding protein